MYVWVGNKPVHHCYIYILLLGCDAFVAFIFEKITWKLRDYWRAYSDGN